MRKNILFVLVLGTLSTYAQMDQVTIQKDPDHNSWMKISSFNISMGNTYYKSNETTLNDLKGLASNNSSIFNTPLDGYTSNANQMFKARQVNINIGFNPYDSKTGTYNRKREFLIGVNYQYGNRSSLDYKKLTTVAGDTFSSPNNKIYTDSLKKSKIRYTEQLGELDLNLAYLYKTDQDRRFSLYTGYGIMLGYSISADIHQSIKEGTRLYYDMNGVPVFYNGRYNIDLSRTHQEVDMAKSILIRPYIPIGANLRLCRNNHSSNTLNLFTQMQLGVEYQQYLNKSTYNITPFVNMSSGIRYNF